MQTVWLGREQVDAYGRDFLQRILAGNQRPEVWCAITVSGFEFARELSVLLEKLDSAYAEAVELWNVGRHRNGGEIVRLTEEGSAATDFTALHNRRVLILDSAIHSGDTFDRVYRRIACEQPALLIGYSLVVKRSSAFFPTYWGCTVEDADRVYFLLNRLPNNRLDTGSARTDASLGWCLNRLDLADCALPPVRSGLGSIDNVNWHERHFGMRTNEHGLVTYLCKIGSHVAGFVTLHQSAHGTLVIDEVAVDTTCHGRGIGGMLVRFAETLARQRNARSIRLFAKVDKQAFYEKFGYRPIPGETPVLCGTEKFQPMEKSGLYRTYHELEPLPAVN